MLSVLYERNIIYFLVILNHICLYIFINVYCRCAPECINYLRFTSASDVWAYGVTLWEMFSYGFQPWAALTGQQVLNYFFGSFF